MTLYKQLLTAMLIIFLILISSVFFTQYKTAHDYLIDQQKIGINNLLLAMEISTLPYLGVDDLDSTQKSIDLIYEHDFHGSIALHLITPNKTLIWHDKDAQPKSPQWFRSLVDIKPVTASSDVQWKGLPIATIKVTGSTSNAYAKLWMATFNLFLNVFIVLIIGSVLLAFVLKHLLKPLKNLQHKANEIAQQRFGNALPLPSTQELKELVQSFNLMSTQIKLDIDQQAEETEKLRKRAYQDPLTGLGNLDYLKAKLTQTNEVLEPTGWFILLQSDLISQHLENNDIPKAESLTQQLSQQLSALANDSTIVVSINQHEFAITTPSMAVEDLNQLAEKVLNLATELQPDPFGVTPDQAMVGIVSIQQNDNADQLLHKARIAIQESRITSETTIALFDQDANSEIEIRTQKQWQELIKQAVANRQIGLDKQKAIDHTYRTIHNEIFPYIQQGEQQFSIKQFINAISYEPEGLLLDMHVLELVFVQLNTELTPEPVAVNITLNSINSANFLRWLHNKLHSHPHLSEHLIFEIPESAFIRHHENARQFCDIIHQYNYHFGIDNFGHNFSAIGYLNEFKPSYVKLDFAYTVKIENQNKADVLSAILRIANNLEIKTIATKIETLQQIEQLTKFHLYGYQGLVITKISNKDNL